MSKKADTPAEIADEALDAVSGGNEKTDKPTTEQFDYDPMDHFMTYDPMDLVENGEDNLEAEELKMRTAYTPVHRIGRVRV
ncbi:MAG: hypothetical protein AAF479_06645 [Pseudomonadota bacterium]